MHPSRIIITAAFTYLSVPDEMFAVLHPMRRHFHLRFFFLAARWTEYPIATACLIGFPAAISRLMFADRVLSDVPFFKGIV